MGWFKFLDSFFMVFHTIVILFNLFGWVWKRTRIYNLAVLLLTGFSWGGLGIFYGFGYCPLTDWHFHVLVKLGKVSLPNSYIKYFIDRLFSVDINAVMVETFTILFFFVALVISAILSFMDYKGRKKAKKQQAV